VNLVWGGGEVRSSSKEKLAIRKGVPGPREKKKKKVKSGKSLMPERGDHLVGLSVFLEKKKGKKLSTNHPNHGDPRGREKH